MDLNIYFDFDEDYANEILKDGMREFRNGNYVGAMRFFDISYRINSGLRNNNKGRISLQWKEKAEAKKLEKLTEKKE